MPVNKMGMIKYIVISKISPPIIDFCAGRDDSCRVLAVRGDSD